METYREGYRGCSLFGKPRSDDPQSSSNTRGKTEQISMERFNAWKAEMKRSTIPSDVLLRQD